MFHTPSLLVFVCKALIRIVKDIDFNPCLTPEPAVDNLKKYKRTSNEFFHE
jgi:hypothetical protein